MWGCGVASGEVLDCVGWGRRGVEDFGGRWGTAVMGWDVAGVRFGAESHMLQIASGLDAIVSD